MLNHWPQFRHNCTGERLQIRGGKVPAEVVDSFRKLYKIAKENKVSYHDLCVYALGPADGTVKDGPFAIAVEAQTKPEEIKDMKDDLKELAALKDKMQNQKGSQPARKQYAIKYTKLAEAEASEGNYFRANFFLQDAKSAIGLDSLDQLKDPNERDIFAYYQFVFGASLAGQGEFAKGYAALLESRKLQPARATAEFTLQAGKQEHALGWVSNKMKRPIEAITWYQKALDQGVDVAPIRLFDVVSSNPETQSFLTLEQVEAFLQAKQVATKDEPAAKAFYRLVTEKRGQHGKLTTLESSRRNLLDAERDADGEPGSTVKQQQLATQNILVGDALVATGQGKDAMYYLQKGFAIRERLAKESPKANPLQTDLGIAYHKLGMGAISINKPKDALDHFQKGLQIYERVLAATPNDPQAQRNALLGQFNIGHANELLSQFTEAIAWYEKALTAADKVAKPEIVVNDLADIKKQIEACKTKMTAKPKEKTDAEAKPK